MCYTRLLPYVYTRSVPIRNSVAYVRHVMAELWESRNRKTATDATLESNQSARWAGVSTCFTADTAGTGSY